jgi:hypothetical protein
VGEYRFHPYASSRVEGSCSQIPRPLNFKIFSLHTRILTTIPTSRLENRRRIQAMRGQIERFKRKRIEDGVRFREITHQMTYDR